MELESPLADLMNACMTACEAACCGLDAYDFNPVHIASHLVQRGAVDAEHVACLRSQLASLSANYGERGASAHGVHLLGVADRLSGADVDELVREIESNLEVALTLVAESDRLRFARR